MELKGVDSGKTDRPPIQVIDAHVNVTVDGKWFDTMHDASVERLLSEMQEAGISKALLIALPGVVENRYIAQVCQRWPEKFRGFGHITDWSKASLEISEIRAMGLSGVKVHPRFQNLDLLDPALEPAWRMLEEAGLPVMIDGYFQNSSTGLPLYKFTPFYYDRMARRFPGLHIILAHAGAHRVMDAFYVARSHPRFYLDISHVLAYYRNTSVWNDFAFVADKADQKVVFGSDFPEYSPGTYLQLMAELHRQSPEIDMELVLNRNIQKIVDFS